MRRLISLLGLLLAATVFGQTTVRLSDRDENGNLKYAAKYVSVPAPTGKMTIYQPLYSWPSPIYWGDTFIPGGQIEVSNALVDKQHRVGAWSLPATLNVTQGWLLRVLDSNQPPSFDCVGVAWKVKFLTVDPPVPGGWPAPNFEYVYVVAPAGIGPLQYRASVTWSGTHPRWMPLHLANGGFYDVAALRTGGTNNVQAPAPIVQASNIPQEDGTIAYCWVTHHGETALSESTTVTAGKPGSGAHSILPEVIRADYYMVGMFKVPNASPAPHGALGFHVYYNGKRVPAPQCTGTASKPDDWLWPLDMYRLQIFRIDPNGPTHSAAANPRSYLNPVQVALKETSGNVIVDTQEVMPLYCPMIDEYGEWPFKFGRRISSSGAGNWRVEQQKTLPDTTTGFPMYWPALLMYNQYSSWEDLIVNSKYGSCGICFSDYSGGQSFGSQFNRCAAYLEGRDHQTDQVRTETWVTQCIRVLAECEASGHSASELRFMDFRGNAVIPVWFEHIQTANVKMYRMHLYSGYNDRRASVFWLTASNQFDFKDGVFCDCPNNIIFNFGGPAKVTTDGLWVDSGCKSIVDFQGYQTGAITFNNAKMNLWSQPNGPRPNLARAVSTSDPVILTMNNVVFQLNYSSQVDICSPAWHRFVLRMTDCDGPSDTLVLREPTRVQWLGVVNRYAVPGEWGLPDATVEQKAAWAEWQAFTNTPEPGFRLKVPGLAFTPPPTQLTLSATQLTIPAVNQTVSMRINGSRTNTVIPIKIEARTISIPGQVLTVANPAFSVPERSVVFNSATGRQNVRRVDWYADYSVVP